LPPTIAREKAQSVWAPAGDLVGDRRDVKGSARVALDAQCGTAATETTEWLATIERSFAKFMRNRLHRY
jgi:hypothetical protein